MINKKWWKESVVYQIYPRSFCDSNGDGIGDLRGIIQKLDYLKNLGIDVVWISPCYQSPNDDNGYDISDYENIMDEFGTMSDFNELLETAHENGIKIVMDLVVNHSSDEHKWFVESRKTKDNPYRDYYIWREGKGDDKKQEPNNWASYFDNSAWQYDEQTGEYYLHLFSKKQPDLNWENPDLRNEIYNMMNFWLEKGIDGFRMDVVNLYKKPEGLPDSLLEPNTSDGHVFEPKLYGNNEGLLEILQEMNEKTLSKYDVMTVGESVEVTPEIALPYVDQDKHALNMVFQFEVVSMRTDFSWKKLKEIQRKWIYGMGENGWNSQYLANHDQPRSVSTYGSDKDYWLESAKMLATMIHTLPGTPYIYQGEEIGMTNNKFPDIKLFNDINAHYTYRELIEKGKTPEEALDFLNKDSRDHARTPMQWDDTAQAGFTTGLPWIMVNPNYKRINVKEQMCDDNSILNYYKELICLRKENKVMVYGKFKEYEEERSDIYLYSREIDEETWMICLNLTNHQADVELPGDEDGWSYLLSNYGKKGNWEKTALSPYEAFILKKEGK